MCCLLALKNTPASKQRVGARHPERYVKGPPSVALPPTAVHINPDLAMEASQLLDTSGALRIIPTPVDTVLPEVVT